MANLVNAERIGVRYGTRRILADVSLGVAAGEVIGVVGRNGSGKTTLLQLLAGVQAPDSGRVTRSGGTSVGYLHQADDFAPDARIRDVVVAGAPDHVWAADPWTRGVVERLLGRSDSVTGGLDLDGRVAELSGGERRRVALVAVLLGSHDLVLLDEPTNHLDVEAVAALADLLSGLVERGTALLVVSHDRWFLDAVCSRTWELHDGVVDAYSGGYSAYVLARTERARVAAGVAARRANLLRKELAWLRRGPPARTSKPKFRIDAANALIEDEPPPRDSVALRRFASRRLGKDVFDLTDVTVELGGRRLLDGLDWSIGPAARIGVIGVNGAGKTTLLQLLDGQRTPDRGRVRRGSTLSIGHLSQAVVELPDRETVLGFLERERRLTRLANGQEVTGASLLEGFGFTGDRLTTRIGELSGGERRRLQFLRLLIDEPNVLLLDEPTNDLDIETLTVVEDFLDSWPGTLLVVSHDRYFLERTCDVVYALLGDGRCVLLPGGVEEYLARRSARPVTETSAAAAGAGSRAAASRQARKDLSRIEGRLGKLEDRIRALHDQMADAAADYPRLGALQTSLDEATAERDELEEAWLERAEQIG